MRRSMIAGAILLAFLTACKDETSRNESSPDGYPRNQTLYIGGLQWGPPASFNPLHGTPAWPLTGNVNLIYEALFGYNQISGELEGLLGEDFLFSGHSLQVNLHPEAKWHDGTPVTAEDVAYTFELHRKYYTNLHSHWNFLSAVRAEGPHKVVFSLSKENYNPLMVRDIISTTPILPKAVFQKLEEPHASLPPQQTLENIREFKNDQAPLGSGPYTLETYSDQKIVLKRVKNYWGNVRHDGKPPAPMYIIHSGYKSNDKFNLALRQGMLDLSQTFYPQIWKSFDEGVKTWYADPPYYIPMIIPSLLLNLTKEPTSDPAFRKAVAHALNYGQIKKLAMYGYTPDVKPGFIIPFGKEAQYYNEQDAKAFGKMYDPDRAKQILREAGYTWGEDGLLVGPGGKKLPSMTATCPSGWSDWESTLKIAVTSLREVGIDVREKFVEYPIWDKELKNGLFDFTMRTPQPDAAPSLPWSRFDKVMSSEDFRPVGQVMYQNEGRYKNPVADSLLNVIPKLDSEEKRKEAYYAINRLFMEELPVIPLMYRPWHLYQFSTQHWQNFPTESNPYAPPQMAMIGAGVKTLWGIKPVH